MRKNNEEAVALVQRRDDEGLSQENGNRVGKKSGASLSIHCLPVLVIIDIFLLNGQGGLFMQQGSVYFSKVKIYPL